MRVSDAVLVGRVRRGDAAAFDVLVQRHLPAAYATALAEVGSAPDAAGLCQDAFLTALDHLEECAHPEQFAAWLLDVVNTLALRYSKNREASLT